MNDFASLVDKKRFRHASDIVFTGYIKNSADILEE